MLSIRNVWDSCLESDGTVDRVRNDEVGYLNGLVWLHCPISHPVDASWYLDMRLDDIHLQTWLFSSISTYHSTDLLTARGVAHLVLHGTSGSTSYETIPPVRLETSGGAVSTVDMVVWRRDGPRRLRGDDDDGDDGESHYHTIWLHHECRSVGLSVV